MQHGPTDDQPAADVDATDDAGVEDAAPGEHADRAEVTQDATTSGPLPAAGANGVASDPLLEVRVALDEVDELPLGERAVVFERTHAVVVEELRALDLG